MYKNIKSFKSFRGFAMIEALIAITVILISISAPFALSVQTSKIHRLSLLKITAINLAESNFETLNTYKKSLDIYCFQNSADCGGDTSGFSVFEKKVNDPVSGFKCQKTVLPNTPCYFDITSLVEGNLKPDLIKKSDDECKYLHQYPSGLTRCKPVGDNTSSTSTIFTKKTYLDVVDSFSSGGEEVVNSVRVISFVCLFNSNCEYGDSDSVAVVNYIYK